MLTPWRRTHLGLPLSFAVFGLLAGAGVVAFPGLQPILFVLYWTFVFAATLLWFLTPERRIRARIADQIYADLAANESALVTAYDLCDTRVYVPTRGSEDDPPARLFVPRCTDYDLPVEDDLGSLLVTSDAERRQGLSLVPSGSRLFREFESMLSIDLDESPNELSRQLADGIVEGLELADRVTPDVRSAERRITFEIEDSVYGPIDRFDHPVQSFLAVGLAVGLGRPVTAETKTLEDRSRYVVTCRWELDEQSDRPERTGDSQAVHVRSNG